MSTYKLRLADPDGYVRVVEADADSAEEAEQLLALGGNVHWYERVISTEQVPA